MPDFFAFLTFFFRTSWLFSARLALFFEFDLGVKFRFHGAPRVWHLFPFSLFCRPIVTFRAFQFPMLFFPHFIFSAFKCASTTDIHSELAFRGARAWPSSQVFFVESAWFFPPRTRVCHHVRVRSVRNCFFSPAACDISRFVFLPLSTHVRRISSYFFARLRERSSQPSFFLPTSAWNSTTFFFLAAPNKVPRLGRI